jgi:putative hydrolase of the HAD superfamily
VICPLPSAQRVPSPLGCRLHDWNTHARESIAKARRRDGLILDLDDTLYPREQFVQSGLMAVARHVEETRGIPARNAFVVMTDCRREGGAGRELQALCAWFGLTPDVIQPLVELFRSHQPALQLPAETAAVLTALKADGWRMVVLTNGLPRVQRAKVYALGLHALVEDVVYAEEHTPGGKPSSEPFRAVLKRLALPARRCICVGDDPIRGIAAARALGMTTVWVSAHRRAGAVAPGTDDPVAPNADAHIEALVDLPAALVGLKEVMDADAA